MSENTPNGITGITIKGFKSLREKTHIDIRPLTILAGANSSGKSSIMQPLLLMKQTIEAPYDPGALLILGTNANFTSPKQFLIYSSKEKYEDIEVQIRVDKDIELLNIFRANGKDAQLDLIETEQSDPFGNMKLYPRMMPSDIRRQLSDTLRKRLASNTSLQVIRSRCFLVLQGAENKLVFQQAFIPAELGFATAVVQNALVELIHIPGIRGNPQRVYPTIGDVGTKFAGIFENYTAGIIHDWHYEQDKRLDDLVNFLKRLGLTSQVAAQMINAAQIEISVGRTLNSDADDLVSIADVGFGVSQVLPVLVATLVAQPGQLVYIEQPELHLHPRAQVALASILADAAKRGVHLVIETHSSLLLLGIQTLIAEGELPNDKVILHWFTRDDDGNTTVESVEPDANGAYGDWPEDFVNVEMDTQRRYIRAVSDREFGSNGR